MFFYLVDKYEGNYDKSINKLQPLLRIFDQLNDIGIDSLETFDQIVKEIDKMYFSRVAKVFFVFFTHLVFLTSYVIEQISKLSVASNKVFVTYLLVNRIDELYVVIADASPV